jgi:hypothetical protein
MNTMPGKNDYEKVPGAGTVYMIYDARDRMVMTQDANLRTAQKWIVTVYENNFNRPVNTYLITDPSNYDNAAYHRGQAYSSTTYPSVGNFTNELLTETHYDDYNNLPSGLTSTLYNSGYSTYLTASSSSPEYAESVVQSSATKGMVTWTKVKVLGTANQYNTSVNIYDNKGRVLQIQSINITGGLDVLTNQFSFSGQVLRSHTRHQKLGGAAQTYDLASKNNYDDLGRVSTIEKNVNNTGWKTISSLSYDAIGQVKSKSSHLHIIVAQVLKRSIVIIIFVAGCSELTEAIWQCRANQALQDLGLSWDMIKLQTAQAAISRDQDCLTVILLG